MIGLHLTVIGIWVAALNVVVTVTVHFYYRGQVSHLALNVARRSLGGPAKASLKNGTEQDGAATTIASIHYAAVTKKYPAGAALAFDVGQMRVNGAT